MKKKKHRIGGVSKSAMTEAVIIGLTAPTGVIIAQEAKAAIAPMLITATDTAEQQKSKGMYLNIGTGLVGLVMVAGGAYMKDSQPEIGAAMIGTGAGITGQCVLKPWLQFRGTEGGAAANIAGNWTNKAWQDARKKAIAGADNKAPGMMGADNKGNGIMGKLNIPVRTRQEEVGRPRARRIGNCSL